MSDEDLHEELARHRGFAIKAREVLLEPQPPFVVVEEATGNLSGESDNIKLPHRGFTAKAREMLVERQTDGSCHGSKSFHETIRSNFNTSQIQQLYPNHSISDKLWVQSASIVPQSKLSKIKAHKLLGKSGITRSANEIFYDRCKRERNPLSYTDLQSNRNDASETAKMMDDLKSFK